MTDFQSHQLCYYLFLFFIPFLSYTYSLHSPTVVCHCLFYTQKTDRQEIMVIDAVFDSLCRCFGSATPSKKKDRSAESSHHSEDATVSSDVKRRTQRLQLDDKEFDNLFQQQQQHQRQRPHSQRLNVADLEQAHALARAKLAATSAVPRRAKRKSTATKRDEIFRSRKFDPKSNTSGSTVTSKSHTTFSRFLSNHKVVANALCFGTPIREVEDEVEDCSDTNTLNTCEDTITSTLYFDNKYSHIQEKRPPMPLFQSFRVEEDLRRIVATDSHNSMKMISLMKEVHAGTDMQLDSSSEDEEEDVVKTPKNSPHRKGQHVTIQIMDKNDPPPPVLQNSSCSTASSQSLSRHPSKRQAYPNKPPKRLIA